MENGIVQCKCLLDDVLLEGVFLGDPEQISYLTHECLVNLFYLRNELSLRHIPE